MGQGVNNSTINVYTTFGKTFRKIVVTNAFLFIGQNLITGSIQTSGCVSIEIESLQLLSPGITKQNKTK
jgi:hypothetical protein